MTDKELVQSLRRALANSDAPVGHFWGVIITTEMAKAAADRLEALLPPLKIGDTAWGVQERGRYGKRVLSGHVSRLGYNDNMELCAGVKNVGMGKIGEKIFLTREEAEKALEKIQEEKAWKD